MSALSPTCPDDGPRRHTTVAMEKGSRAATSATASARIPGPTSVAGVLDGGPDPVGEHRHVDVADPEVGDRVDHGVHERGRGTDGRRLAHALGTDGVVRRGYGGRQELEPGRLP